MMEDRIDQRRIGQINRRGAFKDLVNGLMIGSTVTLGSLGLTKAANAAPSSLEAKVASSWNGANDYSGMLPAVESNVLDGIYNFSGYIKGFPDSTQALSGATLTFKSPDGITYPSVQTGGSGNYNTSIDTYVKVDDVQLEKDIAISNPVLNPTGDRSGFYINIPDIARVKLIGVDERGRDANSMFKERMGGIVQPGVYFQEVDFSNLPSARYFVEVQIGNETKTLKFTHVKGGKSYTGMHSAPSQGSWMKMEKTSTQNGLWEMTIEHPDYRPRKVLFNAQEGDNYLDLDLIHNSWDLDFFDEITYRKNGGGTSKWKKCPKLLIIDGPIPGYNNFETPSQAEIDTLIKVWKDYQKHTNGFIDISDSNIYITHDINDPNFQDAVEQIFNGNVSENEGWDISLWTDKVNTGDHGETVENGEIKGAVQRYKQGYAGRSIMQIESSQSLGFPNDPANMDQRMQNGEFTGLYKECMRLNYSRPRWTLTPDTATQPLNQ
ncbi:MAG: hypothetical protein ABIL68_16935 [bacterium]